MVNYGNEGLGWAWDCIEVFQVALFITTAPGLENFLHFRRELSEFEKKLL